MSSSNTLPRRVVPVTRAARFRAPVVAASLLIAIASSAAAQAKPAPSTAPAPAPHDTAVDSLRARLDRAEQALEAMRQRLDDSEQGATRTASGIHLELSGHIIMNAFANSGAVNNVDDPQFAQPDTGASAPARGASASPRQTQLGFRATAPDVLGGSFFGDLDVDFYGGQQPSAGGRTFPLIRLRIARMIVTWPHAQLLVGQETPLFSDANPISPAAIGSPEFSTSGNLWLWIPQVRFGVTTPGSVRFGVQGAALAPNNSDPQPLFSTQYDIAERSNRPMLEGRAHLAWGDETAGGDVGCAVNQAWFKLPAGIAGMSAFGCDLHVPVWIFELRGEAFRGKGLRSLGGGGIGQLTGTDGLPIDTRGGWAQLNMMPGSMLTLSAGCGVDDPDDTHLPATGRKRNAACAASTTIHPAGPMFFGFEYRRMKTTYMSGAAMNDHYNLAFGFDL